MNVALWWAAGLLALVALIGGLTKTLVPHARLAVTHGAEWTAHFSTSFVKTLGGLEILAAIGLVLPAVVGIAAVLVPVTAICWVVLMVGAMITHIRYDSAKYVVLNLTYLIVATFIAWGRLVVEPFAG